MRTATRVLDTCGPSSAGLVDAKTHTHTHVNGKHTFWTPWASPSAAAPRPRPRPPRPYVHGGMVLAHVMGTGNKAIS